MLQIGTLLNMTMGQVLYMIPCATASSFYRSRPDFTPRVCHLHRFPFTDNDMEAEKGREVRYKKVLVSVLPDSLIPSL